MTTTFRPWESLSPEELEFQYNPQRACPNFNDYRALREPANQKAAVDLEKHQDIAYSDHTLRKLDIYTALGEGRRPVHIHLHGGYWRAQDKANYAFVADMLVKQGIMCVVLNYELCPDSTLDAVAESAIAGVEWVHRNIATYGGDPDMISISGHSAGAHLAAEVLATDWAARSIDPGFIVGVVAVSGIYNPAPAALISVNEQLRLTPDIIARRNVEARPVLVKCPVALLVGGDEPWQWIDQTFRYSHHLHRYGNQPAVQVMPNHNHFSIILEFMKPASPIGNAILKLANGGRMAAEQRSSLSEST